MINEGFVFVSASSCGFTSGENRTGHGQSTSLLQIHGGLFIFVQQCPSLSNHVIGDKL